MEYVLPAPPIRGSEVTASVWPKPANLKIGHVARMLGTNVSTLRYYEREGLLNPGRSAGGTRLYNTAEVARFEIALELTSLGIPLQDLIALVRARPGSPSGGHSSRKVLRQMHGLRETIKKRRAQLDRILQSIERATELVSTCFECTLEPTNSTCPDCPCSTRFEESSILALTWSVRD